MSTESFNCWPGGWCAPLWANVFIGLGIAAAIVVVVMAIAWMVSR